VIRVIAYPRLHLSLLDCGEATYRRAGGVGLSVEGLPTIIEAEPADTLDVAGLGGNDVAARRDMSRALERLAELVGPLGVRLTLTSCPPQHVGLGSKTSLLLASLHAACHVVGAGIERQDVQRLSGRGGTSGVGVSAFYTGGFLVDAGHARISGEPIRPSSATRPREVPPVVVRRPVPQRWRIVLMLASRPGAAGAAEVSFFANNTPIPAREVERAISLTYHGLIPSLLSADLSTFGRALCELQGVGFKQREVLAQAPEVQYLLADLWRLEGVAAGLSSMGPLVFAIHDADDHRAHDEVSRLALEAGVRRLGSFAGRNAGYVLEELTQ
jgi:beta-ribofuranosylaminobenzene 5'-phosphate synthase